MKKLIGFVLFWIAIGMTISLLIPGCGITVLIIFVLLLIGYNLYLC